jgi:4-amino-4-deoxy-L-arabinose transferase-like glycosyltransferase
MSRRVVIILLMLSVIVFLAPLPYLEITSGHEAREGVRLRAMQASGDWLFSDVLRKPPLYYWLGGVIARMRGGTVDEISLRLPSGLLASAGLLLVLFLGRVVTTPRGATWASFFLLTSPLYVQQSHSGRTDMTLCFFVSCSLLLSFSFQAGSRQTERPSTWQAYVLHGLFALTLLSKGPVGLILVGLPIMSFALWRREGATLRWLLRPGPLFLFVLLGGGWYGSAFRGAGESFWRTQIMEENVLRFVGGVDQMKPLYYLGPVFGVFAPWSVFLPFALWRAIKERHKEAGPFFLALWWITGFLFFQLAAYKRARYLLPLLPASSLLVGWWLETSLFLTLEQAQQWRGWKPLLILLSFLIGLLLAFGALFLAGSQSVGPVSCRLLDAILLPEIRHHAEHYCSWLASHFWLAWICVAAFALCLAFAPRLLWQASYEKALAALIGALVLVYSSLYPSWLIVTSRADSPRPYAECLAEALGTEPSVGFISPYDEQAVPVLFALQNHKQLRDVQWPWHAQQPTLTTGFYLVTADRQKELLSNEKGTWTEVRRDLGSTQWPIALFYYTAN